MPKEIVRYLLILMDILVKVGVDACSRCICVQLSGLEWKSLTDSLKRGVAGGVGGSVHPGMKRTLGMGFLYAKPDMRCGHGCQKGLTQVFGWGIEADGCGMGI